jgi:hypothetical protein
MGKPIVLVSKTGSVFYTRLEAASNSASGEQGETEGLMRHLAERNDIRVIYVGQYRGETLEGVEVFQPNVSGLNEYTTGEEQRRRFDEDWERFEPMIRGDEVLGMICVAGYSPTWSYIDNPHYANIYATGIRYSAPILEIIGRTKAPRILVNNDPRTYPKDQEMSTGWPWLIPCAVLDQVEADTTQVVGGVKYRRKSVWARPESWAHHLRRENTDEYATVCIAHAHIADGCKLKGRDAAWHNVLGDPRPPGLVVYGKGWEHYSGYDPSWMLGPIKPNQVMDLLNMCVSCPAVALDKEFYTGKVYVCEAQGCIPLLYGDSCPFTWDPYGALLPLDSEWRIRRPGDYRRIVQSLIDDTDLRQQMRDHWHRACQPQWGTLDCLIDDLLRDVDIHSSYWWSSYGGYRPI